MSKITPELITELAEKEVFVFGSNLAGNHIGGAARTALERFGAISGQGEGIQGDSYALPTLSADMRVLTVPEISKHVKTLLTYVKETPDKHFLITPVACGIAGHKPEDIAPLFREFYPLENVSLPQVFLDVIIVSGFKGFHKDLTCGGMGGSATKVYTENTIFEEDIQPETCNRGMHFCQMPLDVLSFYPPKIGAEYAEVESYGEVQHESNKTATNKLKVKGKINVFGLFKAHFDIVKETISKAVAAIAASEDTINTAGNYAHANTAGNEAHANTAGNYAHANTAGNESIACSLGVHSRSKAKHGWIVIVDWQQDEEYNWLINNIHSAKVGGKINKTTIESDTWYWFENGKLKSEK